MKSPARMLYTRRGRTPMVAFCSGSRKSTPKSVRYLAFIKSTTRRSTGGSVEMRAMPSMTTGSEASSVVMQQRGSAARLRTLREPAALVNQSVLSSSHMPQTGMTCGRPSGQTVATQ